MILGNCVAAVAGIGVPKPENRGGKWPWYSQANQNEHSYVILCSESAQSHANVWSLMDNHSPLQCPFFLHEGAAMKFGDCFGGRNPLLRSVATPA